MGLLATVALAVLAVASVHAQTPCYDRSSSCPQQYCTIPTYRQYMQINCARTCGFCQTGGTCRDDPSCRYYPSIDCTNPYVRSICPRTCRACGGPTTVQPPSTKVYPPPTGNCGKSQVSGGRVINGQNAKRGDWPWQILMMHNGRPGCGGSIIAPQWVVTAAHCVDGKEYPASAYTVRVGDLDWKARESSQKDYRVARVIKHRTFRKSTFDADIALFKLQTPIQFDQYVSPICLPSAAVKTGKECYITGWGKIHHPGQMHTYLQQAPMKVADSGKCDNQNRKYLPFRVTPNMVCAGDGGATRTSGCHGDSGGPFVCYSEQHKVWELHGAVSYGSGSCSSRETYTVFARVHQLRDWIETQMKNY